MNNVYQIIKRIILLTALLGSLAQATLAAEDYYHFDTREAQQQFDGLTSQLRCLVCQNQTIAESNAGLANDLRNQIYQQILQGRSDQQIVDYLVARYGDFILYRPPFNATTFVLWCAPLLILLSGIGYLIYYLKRRQAQ